MRLLAKLSRFGSGLSGNGSLGETMADRIQQISDFLHFEAESRLRRAREMEQDLYRGIASIQHQLERHPYSEWLGSQLWPKRNRSFTMWRIGGMSFHITRKQRPGRRWEIGSLGTFSKSLAPVTRGRGLGYFIDRTALWRRSLRGFKLSPLNSIGRSSRLRRRGPQLLPAGCGCSALCGGQ